MNPKYECFSVIRKNKNISTGICVSLENEVDCTSTSYNHCLMVKGPYCDVVEGGSGVEKNQGGGVSTLELTSKDEIVINSKQISLQTYEEERKKKSILTGEGEKPLRGGGGQIPHVPFARGGAVILVF